MKRFEYSSLGKEFKKQTSIAEKQYQKFNNAFEPDKKGRSQNKKQKNLVYNNYFTFCKYHNTNDFTKRSLDSKLNYLKELKDQLELFYDNLKIKPNNEQQMKPFKERKAVFNTALELYTKLLAVYKTQYDTLTKAKKKGVEVKNKPESLSID